MRRVLRIRSVHTHPGRDLSDIITARLPSGLISSDGQVVCVSLSWVLLKAFEEIYIVPGCMRRYSMGFLYILFQDQEDKIGRKSQGSKRYSYVLCAIHCWQLFYPPNLLKLSFMFCLDKYLCMKNLIFNCIISKLICAFPSVRLHYFFSFGLIFWGIPAICFFSCWALPP